MEFEDKIKQKLILRGFTEKQILNNKGLISSVIDETILEVVKAPAESQGAPYTYIPPTIHTEGPTETGGTTITTSGGTVAWDGGWVTTNYETYYLDKNLNKLKK
jgi:hypothetical protein